MSFWRMENLLFFLSLVLQPLIRSRPAMMVQLLILWADAYIGITHLRRLPLRRLSFVPECILLEIPISKLFTH